MRYLKNLVYCLFFFTLILLTPVSSLLGSIISKHLAGIDTRFEKKELTVADRLQCKIIYHSIVIVGKIIYPESANLLEHYLDGTGKNLYLEADYFRKSPVVRKNLNSMRVNETKEVRFKQHEDWRLSYALNPFYLKKGRKMIKIYQEIEFSTKKGVYTNLNFYFFKVRLPDRLVHVLKPKPFMVYISWNVDQ